MLPRRSKDSDTDPSTPDALRLPGHDTDPGLGPTAADARATHRGLGATPPPTGLASTPAAVSLAAATGPKKDSVELLLDGMPEQQPQAPRTVPQSAGESSAAYHVEHSLRPAHTSPDEVPKVVVERPPQHQTMRIDRARLQAVMDQAVAARAEKERAESLPMGLRIAIATVAGLAVVLVIFLIARPSVEPTPVVVPAAPAATTVLKAPPSMSGASAPVAAPPAVVTAAPPVATDSAPTTAAPMPQAPAAPPTAPVKPKPRSSATAPTGTSGDLGEFKTTFH